jgi:acetyl esterase/lipase
MPFYHTLSPSELRTLYGMFYSTPPGRLQLLIYPSLDLTMSSPSIDEYATGYLLTKARVCGPPSRPPPLCPMTYARAWQHSAFLTMPRFS